MERIHKEVKKMKVYSIAYSKTDEDALLEDSHFINGLPFKWDTLDTKKAIVHLLNDKEKQIDELTKENEFLRWYSEELEVHLPKDLVKQVKECYEKEVKK